MSTATPMSDAQVAKSLTEDVARRIASNIAKLPKTMRGPKITKAHTSLIPAIPSPINSARNASIMAPISAIAVAAAVAIAWMGVTIAWIGVTVTRITVAIVAGISG